MDILVLYYSRFGSVEKMAQEIACGIDAVEGCSARIRTVPAISTVCEKLADDIPESGAPYVTEQDLIECHGLALGSPTRFGNMASAMKYFWDGTGAIWATGKLVGKPACVFSSSASMHGGQETTLISMMFPLIHQGCIIVGLPYSEPELAKTKSGGTPYGPTHVAGPNSDLPLTDDEIKLCRAQGRRLATITAKLG